MVHRSLGRTVDTYSRGSAAAAQIGRALGGDLFERALERLEGDYGTPVYEREWDLLVVLSGCGYEALEEHREAYPFLDSLRPAFSVGSTPGEWVANTFRERHAALVNETTYVTGVPWSGACPSMVEPYRIKEPRRQDGERRVAAAPAVTDLVVQTARDEDTDRLIAHYAEPGGTSAESARARRLDRVLESVGRVLRNVDAEQVVVTGDHHGDAPRDGSLECRREVPWVETTARDTGAYDPGPGTG